MASSIKPSLLAHSPLGPSAGARWINCPGSVLLTEDMPPVDSDYAMEGNAGHTLTEWVRQQKRPAIDFLDEVIKVPYQAPDKKGQFAEFPVDMVMVDAAQDYVEYCEDFGGDAELYEVRVHYDAWVPNGFGTSDDVRIRFRDNFCKVTDFKYGQGVAVSAEGNIQNRLYALGIYHDFGDWLYDIDKWELAIHQPRMGYVGSEIIATEELLEWANTVVAPAAKRALQPGAPFKAGSWCQFCKARLNCETRAQAFVDAVMTSGELDNIEDIAEYARVKKVGLLDTDTLVALYHRRDEVSMFLKDLDAYAMQELQAGRDFGGFYLAAGRSRRKYRDEEAAEEALVLELGDDAYMPSKLRSPAQAEQKLGKRHPFLAAHVYKPEGKPTIVPADDGRPRLNATRDNELDDLTNDDDDTGDFLT